MNDNLVPEDWWREYQRRQRAEFARIVQQADAREWYLERLELKQEITRLREALDAIAMASKSDKKELQHYAARVLRR